MNSNDEQKKLWKEEANQLKEDLKNRKKIIKKREVDIKFPKKNPLKNLKQSNTPVTSKSQDTHLKNLINFTD
tara:strand:+ start:53 stop:268 length:216 start_codon:yes stop_codon:yes gene_type:complete